MPRCMNCLLNGIILKSSKEFGFSLFISKWQENDLCSLFFYVKLFQYGRLLEKEQQVAKDQHLDNNKKEAVVIDWFEI